MFTWRHIVWLVICAVIIFISVRVYCKKRPNLNSVLTIAIVIAFACEIVKIITNTKLVPSQSGELMFPYITLNHLPLHFCAIQVFLILAARFTKNDKFKENLLAFMAPTCVIGAVFAILLPSIYTAPNSVREAFTSPSSYRFFVYHSMLIAIGLIIICSNNVKWSMKHFRNTTLVVYLFGFTSIYLNSLLASPTYIDGKLVSVDFAPNFFFTNQTPIGIKLTQTWQWQLYLAILAVLIPLLLYLFHLPLVLRQKRESNNL